MEISVSATHGQSNKYAVENHSKRVPGGPGLLKWLVHHCSKFIDPCRHGNTTFATGAGEAGTLQRRPLQSELPEAPASGSHQKSTPNTGLPIFTTFLPLPKKEEIPGEKSAFGSVDL